MQPVAPGKSGGIRTVGNILWFVLCGLWLAIGYLVAGVVMCLTVIGIPFGIQSFKLAGFVLAPFGKVVVNRANSSQVGGFLGNVIWFLLSGLWLFLGFAFSALMLCLTIVGIPFGVAAWKLAVFSLFPFGKRIAAAGSPLAPGETISASF